MDYGVSEWVVNPVPAAPPQAINLRDGETWRNIFGGGKTSSGVNVDHKTTIGYPPFWRGVNLLANGVSGLPVNVYRRTGDDREVAKTHPAHRMVKYRASSIMRASKFRKTMQGHALLFGNGFAYIERDERERPKNLWILNPQAMIVRYMDGELWYATTINGEPRKFPGRNILHITGLSHDGVVGYSAVDLMAEALGVGMAAQRFGGKFFGQGANMSGLLMVPGHFNEEKIRNTLAAWGEMNEGLSNAHKVALLQDGVKFQQLTINPEQAQFLQTRDFEVRSTVANILGVPPHLLGDDSRTSHSSLEQENQSFLVHSLGPWLHEWEGELTAKLLSEREIERDTHYIEFNREAAVQMQFKEKIEGFRVELETGIASLNEVRKKLNMPSIGPDGDRRYRPANWAEIGQEPSQNPADSQQSAADSGDPPPNQAQALVSLIQENVSDAVSIEKRRLVHASEKERNFCQWLDGFYSAWCSKTVPGLSSPAAVDVKTRYAAESKRQLLEIAGCSTAETLASNVEELVNGWSGRAVALVADLMETIQ